jgi:adenosylcobinamide-GDP ribazoletransferase
VIRAADELSAAIVFLTRLPLPSTTLPGRSGVSFYPLVGAIVGASVASVCWMSAQVFDPLLAGVAGLLAGALLTGALHLDGLADTADALAGQTRERRLEIARDHHVGTFAVVALLLDQLAKAGALATLTRHPGLIVGVATAGALARAAAPLSLLSAGSARREGLAWQLRCDMTKAGVAVGAIIAVVLAAVALAPTTAVLVVAAAGATTAVISLVAASRFGGATGDTLGSTIELVEVAALLVIASQS